MKYGVWVISHLKTSMEERYLAIYVLYYYHNINSDVHQCLFYLVHKEDHNWIQTPATSWLSQSYI